MTFTLWGRSIALFCIVALVHWDLIVAVGGTREVIDDVSCTDYSSHLQIAHQSVVSEDQEHATPGTANSVAQEQSIATGACIKGGDQPSLTYNATTLWSLETAKTGPSYKNAEFNYGPWPGLYNPSMVELPPSFQKDIASARFALVSRRDSHQCSATAANHGAGSSIPARSNQIPGLVTLLDENFCVLDSSPITVSGIVNLDRVAQDIRLFVDDGKLYASFVLWHRVPDGFLGKGLWMAPITTHQKPFKAHLNISLATRIGGHEEKNYGLFQGGEALMALTWLDAKDPKPADLDPFTWWTFRPAAEKAHHWHNSAHLLPIPDGSGDLLGIMHVHTDPQQQSAAFTFGRGYKQKFFRMSGKAPYVMSAMGGEFCLSRENGLCESVQMVMSMTFTSNSEILVSYGVNDCESRFSSFSLGAVLEDLSPLESSSPLQVMQVPQSQPWLTELADLVTAFPAWKFAADAATEQATKEKPYTLGLNLRMMSQDSNDYAHCDSVTDTYGDWPVCKDWLPSGCVVYDFGIANEWYFSDGMASEQGCDVHAFDPSDGHLVEHRAHVQENVSFHYLGLSGGHEKTALDKWKDSDTNGHGYGSVIGPLKRLDQIMAHLGHRVINLLKIDCEGCEMESLAGVIEGAPEALACVQVLLVELHFAKRFSGSETSLLQAGEVFHHLRQTGWKVWFGVQRGWGPDRGEQELPGWRAAGGDSCCYNAGLVNPRFDPSRCSLPETM